jgi:hypothetical protein
MSVQEERTAIRPTKGANTFTSKEQDGDTEVVFYPDRSSHCNTRFSKRGLNQSRASCCHALRPSSSSQRALV